MDNQTQIPDIPKDTRGLIHGEILYAIIRTKDQVVYQGNVAALTSYNDKGTFDVLPEHINFISLIKDRLIVHEKIGQDKEIPVQRGILKVFSNKVFVYVVS